MAGVKTLTTKELKEWLDEGKNFVLLDVLSAASYEARHIPGAKSAPASDGDFLKKVAELVPDKKTPVVAYCSSASCGLSPAAARRLSEEGYENVYHYRDGLAGWQNAGYSFEGEAAE